MGLLWVNCMVCELHLKKAATKNKTKQKPGLFTKKQEKKQLYSSGHNSFAFQW